MIDKSIESQIVQILVDELSPDKLHVLRKKITDRYRRYVHTSYEVAITALMFLKLIAVRLHVNEKEVF